eukprot:3811808-Amphidinium_carterae.1
MECLVACLLLCFGLLLYVVSGEFVESVISRVVCTLHGHSFCLSPSRSTMVMQRISVRWSGQRRILQRATSSRRSLETIPGYRANLHQCVERRSKHVPYSRVHNRRNKCNRVSKVIDVSEIEEMLTASLCSSSYSDAPNTAWGATKNSSLSRRSGALPCGARRMLRLDRQLREARTTRQIRCVLRAQHRLCTKHSGWPVPEGVLRVQLPASPQPVRMCIWRAEIDEVSITPSGIERMLFTAYPTALERYDRVCVVEGMRMLPHRLPMETHGNVITIVPDVVHGSNTTLPQDYDETVKRVLSAIHGTIKPAAVRLILRGDSATYRKVACTHDPKIVNSILQAAARRYTIISTAGNQERPATRGAENSDGKGKGEGKPSNGANRQDNQQPKPNDWKTVENRKQRADQNRKPEQNPEPPSPPTLSLHDGDWSVPVRQEYQVGYPAVLLATTPQIAEKWGKLAQNATKPVAILTINPMKTAKTTSKITFR